MLVADGQPPAGTPCAGAGGDREGDKATCPGVGQGLDLLLALGTVGSVGPKPQSKDALCFGRDIR